MSDTPWYDDPAAMEAQIVSSGLAGLQLIDSERSTAGYKRRERLHDTIVLGRFMFDTCGNLGTITDRIPALICPNFPRVIRTSEAIAIYPELRLLSWSMGPGSAIPEVDDHCASCGKPWSLRDVHDFHRTYGDAVRHVDCARFKLVVDEVVAFQKILADAKIPFTGLVPIANQYTGSQWSPPWFRVSTPRGVIVMGWRKRVIALDWSESKIDANGRDIVAAHEITYGDRSCHCYGDEECTAALVRLRERVEASGGWT